eukprot:Colp12_sorted_trinity150504_noHs@21834
MAETLPRNQSESDTDWEKVEETEVNEAQGGTEKEDEWQDVLGNGNLLKKILKPGQHDTRPIYGQQATIHYVGKQKDGTVFHDTRAEGKPVTFRISEGDVSSVFDLITPLMDFCEVAYVKAGARYCYGEYGWPEKGVKPNEDLEFEIELINTGEPRKGAADMTVAEKLHEATVKRERGNALFKIGDFGAAMNSYNRAAGYLDLSPNPPPPTNAAERVEDEQYGETEEERKELNAAKVVCLTNLATAQRKVSCIAVEAAEGFCACHGLRVFCVLWCAHRW